MTHAFPFLTEIRSIEAESLGHPLIDNGVRVTNDFSLKDQILIISGSKYVRENHIFKEP